MGDVHNWDSYIVDQEDFFESHELGKVWKETAITYLQLSPTYQHLPGENEAD
jgi:hypothetical protein